MECRQTHKILKNILMIFIFVFVFFEGNPELTRGEKGIKTLDHSLNPKRERAITIAGKVTQTRSYCGGARPTEEMLESMKVPVPYPTKKFYIRLGKTNDLKCKIVADFITDKNGEFSLVLQPGTYSIILEEQVHKIMSSDYKNKSQQVDEGCLMEWWRKPYYILEVKGKNIEDLKFNFHHRCFITNDIPCLTYTGPMPP